MSYYHSNQYQYGAPDDYILPQHLMDAIQINSNMLQEQNSGSLYQYGAPNHYIPPQSLMDELPTQISSNIPQEQSSHSSDSVYQYGAPNYISPQSLMNVPPKQASSRKKSSHPPGSNSRFKRIEDVGSLTPGAKHRISHDPVPTAQSILDGSYDAVLANFEADTVFYVPRLPEHVGNPSLPPIVFSVNGKPGPYLKDILRQRVTLDNGAETIFKDLVWKVTVMMVDWPGVACSRENISCFMDKTRPITRAEMAQIVANSVASVICTGKSGKPLKWGPQVINSQTRAWDLKNIDYRDVRLIGINYYRKLWIPVLAIDVD